MEPPVISHSDPIQCAKGLAYASLLVGSSFLGTHFFLMPLMPLAYFRPALFRQIADFLIGFWLVLPSALMEYLFGVQIHVQGDLIDRERPAILLMNHRTRLDWLFFWNALWRMDPWLLTTEKISLKGILKYLPGAGWAMATNGFLFLDRSFTTDKARMDTMVNYYARSEKKYQLLLFPEGTDKCPLATDRSRKFAEKSGLVQYKYLLHPRTLGFAYLLQRMRKERYVEHVYDVTVAYGERIVQTEDDLILRGLTPSVVHYLVRKIPISSLPASDEELEEWLKTKWAEKEEVLRQFYTNGQFPTSGAQCQKIELSPERKLLHIFVLGVWLALTATWAYLLFTLPYQLWCSLLTTAYFIGLQIYHDGFELFLARLSLRNAEDATTRVPNHKHE